MTPEPLGHAALLMVSEKAPYLSLAELFSDSARLKAPQTAPITMVRMISIVMIQK